ncbi:hypothetical protein [Micromonospora sp. CB01531]|uniref:hypothetical protein n=1 Tax=Micromonospora sp. CB01531 TaxID=1718947 RepID=UPI00093C1923|nr:hypothetical protein [Micromonospora sp. CB01531]OKI47208.1 hypothetical protein A6A27_10175 [Micromonospora sp. CB01531]
MIGQWIGASILLGRPVPADRPYPHICGSVMAAGLMTGRPVRVGHRDCAACAQIAAAANVRMGDDR